MKHLIQNQVMLSSPWLEILWRCPASLPEFNRAHREGAAVRERSHRGTATRCHRLRFDQWEHQFFHSI